MCTHFPPKLPQHDVILVDAATTLEMLFLAWNLSNLTLTKKSHSCLISLPHNLFPIAFVSAD